MNTATLEAQAWRDYHSSDADPLTWIFPFINLSIWSQEELCVFDGRTDNDMLGIPEIEGEELDAVLKMEIRRARSALPGGGVSGGHEEGQGSVAIAEKAFEEGKKRLEGFVKVERESKVEGVVG